MKGEGWKSKKKEGKLLIKSKQKERKKEDAAWEDFDKQIDKLNLRFQAMKRSKLSIREAVKNYQKTVGGGVVLVGSQIDSPWELYRQTDKLLDFRMPWTKEWIRIQSPGFRGTKCQIVEVWAAALEERGIPFCILWGTDQSGTLCELEGQEHHRHPQLQKLSAAAVVLNPSPRVMLLPSPSALSPPKQTSLPVPPTRSEGMRPQPFFQVPPHPPSGCTRNSVASPVQKTWAMSSSIQTPPSFPPNLLSPSPPLLQTPPRPFPLAAPPPPPTQTPGLPIGVLTQHPYQPNTLPRAPPPPPPRGPAPGMGGYFSEGFNARPGTVTVHPQLQVPPRGIASCPHPQTLFGSPHSAVNSCWSPQALRLSPGMMAHPYKRDLSALSAEGENTPSLRLPNYIIRPRSKTEMLF
uniref:Uncharacterized protein n=1 Tax=Chromera velia CCMP2878 TaxID=1169474 RepID=A0A0G4GDN2_9ALVE|eukprot:Cvel_21432.t1-p1 / transcript=Cvel_21432.t1 / gene=Cvel_21432 / organism=Chromera_velia_CCMP2878 / gene_product=hypothetical protein / transcript_product=hypothetical protein / location=Cvel_scaffold2009:22880-24094(+) / protein_length=405 / sequence_SO=supercontig / SO=protein_coding / is_pseudo=false